MAPEPQKDNSATLKILGVIWPLGGREKAEPFGRLGNPSSLKKRRILGALYKETAGEGFDLGKGSPTYCKDVLSISRGGLKKER